MGHWDTLAFVGSATLLVFSHGFRIGDEEDFPMKKILSLVAATVMLTACTTTDPYTGEERTSRATEGAVIGAIAGAIIGGLTNTSDGDQMARNALIGAGIGALAGGAIGNYQDEQEAELRRDLEGTGVRIYRDGDYIELIMPSHITFATDSARLNPDFRHTLHNVARVLNRFDKTYIYVDGHTDTTGSREHNFDLSERRAETVADRLIDWDVMAGRLIVRGFGETDLLVPTADGVNEPENRRVEIQIVPYTDDRNY